MMNATRTKSRLLMATILVGLGVSCVETTPDPPPSQVLGLVEFTLEDNGVQIQTQARWITSSPTLAATSLTPNNLPAISPAGSTTTSDLNGRRYLSASFNLQNPASGVNYNNLTFHAVTVDSTVAGGSSLGGTSLRNLKDSGNTTITDPAVARGIKPTHKLVNVGGNMQVDSSGADFQVFDPTLEVQPVQQAVNAIPALNGHVTALGYGFVARRAANNPARAVSAGQSGYVTLGLHFPITATNTPRFMSLTYVVVNETVSRVTEALEEQGPSSGAVARSLALGAGIAVNVLPGSSLNSSRLVCPVTWAVSSAGLPELTTLCPTPTATFQVGPTRTFKTLQAVMNQLKPGDIVDLDGDATYPSVQFTAAGTSAKPILIRGTLVNGKRPIIQGYAQNSGFAAVKFVDSDHVVFENLEITNGANADRTVPTACVFNQAHEVTLRRVKVRDCANHGILGADLGSGSLTLEEVEVTTSGCDVTLVPAMTCSSTALKHPIYVATDPDAHPGSTLRIVNSYLHDNNAGENIKTRAERVQISYNWLETTPKQYRNLGLYGYEEYTAGVDAPVIDHDIVGNVIVERGSSSMMRTGGDGTGSTRGRTRFVNNTVILDAGFGNAGRPVIRLDGNLETFSAFNNVIHVVGDGANVQFIRENDDLDWVGQPKVLVTHTNLGAGSVYLRTVGGTVYSSSNPPPANSGYRFQSMTTHAPGFVAASSLAQLDLSLVPASLLKGAGTTATNPAGFEIPWSLALPQRNAIKPSSNVSVQLGAPRTDSAAPSLGANQ
jgi:hypothetical protein